VQDLSIVTRGAGSLVIDVFHEFYQACQRCQPLIVDVFEAGQLEGVDMIAQWLVNTHGYRVELLLPAGQRRTSINSPHQIDDILAAWQVFFSAHTEEK
jgi:hypothetical protein